MRTELALAAALAAAAAPASAAGLSPQAEVQLYQGLDKLYDLDYEEARAAFRRLVELEPDNPFGYLFEAGGIWWQSSNEYGLFKDTPTLQGLFEQDVEAALRKSQAYIKSKDPALKADGYFVSGMALGTRGQWSVMKGRWIAAYLDGKKAVKHLNRCVKLDPGYEDAWLGLGLFDYQAARFSGVARIGAILGGMRGDEERGVERIARAVERSRHARRQSAQLLLNIYALDRGDWERALAVVSRLRADNPRSPYFLMAEAYIRWRQGDVEGSEAAARALFREAEAAPAAFRRKELSVACGLAGPACLSPAQLEPFLAWTGDVLRPSGRRTGRFETWIRALRGQALDALGRRDEAAAEHRRVLLEPPALDARERARACLDHPCLREALMASLRERSRGRSPAGASR